MVREGEAGKSLQRAELSLLPTRIRLSSGLKRDESNSTAFRVPGRARRRRPLPADAGADPSVAELRRAYLAAARHAQPERRPDQHPRPPGLSRLETLGRLAYGERRFLLGVPVGVERDRTLATALALTPGIASWLRPRFLSTSSFILSRTLRAATRFGRTGTAGPSSCPRRSTTRGPTSWARRSTSRADSGSSWATAASSASCSAKVRPVDMSTRLTRTSTFDLTAFDPERRLPVRLWRPRSVSCSGEHFGHRGVRVEGRDDRRGADLPLGHRGHALARAHPYHPVPAGERRVRSDRDETGRVAGGQRALDPHLQAGRRPFSRSAPRSAIARGSTVQANVAGTPALSAITSSSITPDLQVALRNGMTVAAGAQRSPAAQRVERERDPARSAGHHGFVQLRLPTAALDQPGAQAGPELVTVLSTTATTCLQQRTLPECTVVSDVTRQEFRGGLDTDLLQTLTGGSSARLLGERCPSPEPEDVADFDHRVLPAVVVCGGLQMSGEREEGEGGAGRGSGKREAGPSSCPCGSLTFRRQGSFIIASRSSLVSFARSSLSPLPAPLLMRLLATSLLVLLLCACKESPRPREFDGAVGVPLHRDPGGIRAQDSEHGRAREDGGMAGQHAADRSDTARGPEMGPRHGCTATRCTSPISSPASIRRPEAAALSRPLGQPPDGRQPDIPRKTSRFPVPTTAARAWRCCSAWPTPSRRTPPRSAWTCCSTMERTTATSRPSRRTTFSSGPATTPPTRYRVPRRSMRCCGTWSPTRISRSFKRATRSSAPPRSWTASGRRRASSGTPLSSSPRRSHTLIDDHLELQKVGIRAIDVVDFDYPSWHTPDDTIDKVSARVSRSSATSPWGSSEKNSSPRVHAPGSDDPATHSPCVRAYRPLMSSAERRALVLLLSLGLVGQGVKWLATRPGQAPAKSSFSPTLPARVSRCASR